MSRVSVIALMGSAVLAAGVVTGGVLAVTQELDVENNPGEQLTLEGVKTGDAAADSGAVLTGARIRAEGSTPKVTETPVVEKPGVNEVAPSDPVRIAPQQPARVAPKPAPAHKKPASTFKKPAPKPKVEKHGDRHWGDWSQWRDRRGDDGGDRRGPAKRDSGKNGGGPGHH